jgi:hypothetical protein
MTTSAATYLLPCVLFLGLVLNIYGASIVKSNHTLGSNHGNLSDHSNASSHGNDTGHGGEHVGIHVASWNFEYVELPLLVCLFILMVALSKIRKFNLAT